MERLEWMGSLDATLESLFLLQSENDYYPFVGSVKRRFQSLLLEGRLIGSSSSNTQKLNDNKNDPIVNQFYLPSFPSTMRKALKDIIPSQWIPHLTKSGILEHGCQFKGSTESNSSSRESTGILEQVIFLWVWMFWGLCQLVLELVSGTGVVERLVHRRNAIDLEAVVLKPRMIFLLEWYVLAGFDRGRWKKFKEDLYKLHNANCKLTEELKTEIVSEFLKQISPSAPERELLVEVLTRTLLQRIIPRHASYGWIREHTAECNPVTQEKHLEPLQKLYSNLTEQGSTIGIPSKEWINIGFQGDNPVTDFRSMGEYGLVCLYVFSHLGRSKKGFFSGHSVQVDSQKDPFYSLAIIGINTANRLARWNWCHIPELSIYLDHLISTIPKEITLAVKEALDILNIKSDNIDPSLFNYLVLVQWIFADVLLNFNQSWKDFEPSSLLQFNLVYDLNWQMRVIPQWKKLQAPQLKKSITSPKQ